MKKNVFCLQVSEFHIQGQKWCRLSAASQNEWCKWSNIQVCNQTVGHWASQKSAEVKLIRA